MEKALEGMPCYRVTIEELRPGNGTAAPMRTIFTHSRDLGVMQEHTGFEFSGRVQFDIYSRDFDIAASNYGRRSPQL